MSCWVLYASEFGNTQKIAEAIGEGMAPVEVRHVKDATAEEWRALRCLVLGSPTQKMDFIEDMHHFLDGIPEGGLQGVRVAAFDTRISIPDVKSRAERLAARVFLHRYAAEPIAKRLQDKGGQQIVPPEGFFVLDSEGPLKDGELDRARAWGQAIRAALHPA